MRLLVDVDDDAQEFVKATLAVGGKVRIRSRGQEEDAVIVGRAVPRSVTGQGNRYRAFYDITLLDEL